MNENIYCVYQHIRLDKDEVFYVGIGKIKRPYDFKWGRNRYWKHIYNLNKKQLEVQILINNLSWKECCLIETGLITYYGRKDLGLGLLCNMTNGGEGCPGRIISKETRKKHSEAIKRNGHPMKGKTHTKEAIIKIRKAGHRKKSQEEIEKIRKANLGRSINDAQRRGLDRTGITPNNAIEVINKLTGKIYNSISDASKDYEKSSQSLERRLYGIYTNDTNFEFYK